jgi:hypothetical protein
MGSPWCRNRSLAFTILAVSSLVVLALRFGSGAALAQSPTPAPTAPGSGGTTFGVVRVLSGNELQRNSGQENQPPVWITIDAKGTSAVVTIGNATRVPLDFNGTVVISLAPSVDAVGTAVSTGAAVIQGNQVVWNGFSLAPGQIVPGILVLAPNGPAGSAPPTTPAISGVTIDAKNAQSSSVVNEQVAGGGPSLAVLASAPTPTARPAPQQPITSAAIAPTSVAPLSRDDARRYATLILGLLLAVLLLVALTTGLLWRTRGALQAGILQPSPAGQAAGATRAPYTALGFSNATQPESGWWIELRDGTEPGRRWRLTTAEVGIGRNLRNDIVVPDPRVSDRHARLVLLPDGGFQLIDDGSTNGSDVNGERVTVPVRIHENDVLRFGSTSFVVRHAEGPTT